jgi:hypothetical protein
VQNRSQQRMMIYAIGAVVLIILIIIFVSN